MSELEEAATSGYSEGEENVEEDPDCLSRFHVMNPAIQRENFDGFSASFGNKKFNNVMDLFRQGLSTAAQSECLGSRPNKEVVFEWLTYEQVINESIQMSSYLSNDCGVEVGSYVGIYSTNCREWVMFEFACFLIGAICVPIYDSLGSNGISHIISHSKPKVMLCKDLDSLRRIIELDSALIIEHFILIDQPSQEAVQDVVYWSIAIDFGKAGVPLKNEAGRDDVAVLCYTSGSIKRPKGVMITHGNLIAQALAFDEMIEKYGGDVIKPIDKNDCYISYISLAHVYERVVQLYCLFKGAKIAFHGGCIFQLSSDMRALRPTLFCAVPLLLNKIYENSISTISDNCLQYLLFKIAMKVKDAKVSKGIYKRNTVWDRLIFRKFQRLLGSKVRLIIVASSAASVEVLKFIRTAISCPVLEAYGQTEAGGCISIALPNSCSLGHVGQPLSCNELKFLPAKELGYADTRRHGEICLRGYNVAKGYFNKTKSRPFLGAGGWLRTGDIGELTDEGFLRIIDRKKDMFKLAQGEYVSAAKLEQIYLRSKFVQQVYVDGDGLQSCPVAIAVPDFGVAHEWARRRNLSERVTEICRNSDFKKAVLHDFKNLASKHKLRSFEIVKDIRLHPENFSINTELLTPTFKIRRAKMRKVFKSQLQQMYSELSQG